MRPKGFEPLPPWFEEAYSERRLKLENKPFAHTLLCYRFPPTSSQAFESVNTGFFRIARKKRLIPWSQRHSQSGRRSHNKGYD